jgi:hypothetical protein
MSLDWRRNLEWQQRSEARGVAFEAPRILEVRGICALSESGVRPSHRLAHGLRHSMTRIAAPARFE